MKTVIKLKLYLLILYPSTSYICDFFLFHIEIEGKGGRLFVGGGGGGPKGMLAPSQIIGGGGAGPLPPAPLLTPMFKCTWDSNFEEKFESLCIQFFFYWSIDQPTHFTENDILLHR